jgi:hypothetical protein
MKLSEVFSSPEDVLDTLDNADRNSIPDKSFADKQKNPPTLTPKKNKARKKFDNIIARKKLKNAEANRKPNFDDTIELSPQGTGLKL